MTVKIPGEKVKGRFITRPNRFEALVEARGEVVLAHVPNTGRLRELFKEGVGVTLVKSNNPLRKTKYSLMFVDKGEHLICIHSVLANKVFEDAVRAGKIRGISGDIRREVGFGKSRIDFFIDGEEKTFVEVKCGTYEENGIVMFPDAPTERGRKHIDELIRARAEGYSAMVAIIAFMDYVTEFTPHYAIDRAFGDKLKQAAEVGVDVRAYRCSISEEEIYLVEEIPVYF